MKTGLFPTWYIKYKPDMHIFNDKTYQTICDTKAVEAKTQDNV